MLVRADSHGNRHVRSEAVDLYLGLGDARATKGVSLLHVLVPDIDFLFVGLAQGE